MGACFVYSSGKQFSDLNPRGLVPVRHGNFFAEDWWTVINTPTVGTTKRC